MMHQYYTAPGQQRRHKTGDIQIALFPVELHGRQICTALDLHIFNEQADLLLLIQVPDHAVEKALQPQH